MQPQDGGEAERAEGVPADGRAEGVAAVDRALSILGAFREGDAALSLAELAARTGLYKSTILRLLASLERGRCAARLADGRWALGPMLFHWGALYARAQPVERHLPAMLAELARRSGETASFWVRHADQRLCLARVRSPHRIRDDLSAGDLIPLPLGAAGKVLTAADPAGLGVVATFGERNPEAAGCAAAVFGLGGRLAGAIALSGPKERMQSQAPAHLAAVAEAASDLTRRLGGDLTPRREQHA
ncbi:IclR family transcriptional regulator [Falsiroseomonas selenitidurans]|uniref:Helix-turn-helix domain-containing protein n=1 Tax=Falsiroseomonas selenitidurans TaxID=2716335 RepID=A0ABX1E5E3_9PROT|nr:helix-turn-helix domain-containing protein [Falsiroseomonas selenitidurans]NKC30987.1 helix-turn-helix domain-containing protein [Falsiroseomonas selenitidurans]